MTKQRQAPHHGNGEVDLFELWKIMWAGKMLIVLVVSLSLVATAACLASTDTTYSGSLTAVAKSELSSARRNIVANNKISPHWLIENRDKETLRILAMSQRVRDRIVKTALGAEEALLAKNAFSFAIPKKSATTTLTYESKERDSVVNIVNAWAKAIDDTLRQETLQRIDQQLTKATHALNDYPAKIRGKLEADIAELRAHRFHVESSAYYALSVITPATKAVRKRPKAALLFILSTILSGMTGVFLVFVLHACNNPKGRLMGKLDPP